MKYKSEFLTKENTIKESSSYVLGELEKLNPIDKYGVTVQFKSSSGQTKWMNVDKDLIKAFNSFFKG